MVHPATGALVCTSVYYISRLMRTVQQNTVIICTMLKILCSLVYYDGTLHDVENSLIQYRTDTHILMLFLRHPLSQLVTSPDHSHLSQAITPVACLLLQPMQPVWWARVWRRDSTPIRSQQMRIKQYGASRTEDNVTFKYVTTIRFASINFPCNCEALHVTTMIISKVRKFFLKMTIIAH